MTQFRTGDIVRIELPKWNSHYKDICPYDAVLTRRVDEGELAYSQNEEKFHFEMLGGPFTKDGTKDYFCVPTRYMKMKTAHIPFGTPLKGGLPKL